jgi:hypothetical protein
VQHDPSATPTKLLSHLALLLPLLLLLLPLLPLLLPLPRMFFR